MSTATSLMEHLRQVPDPRIERTRRHELMDLLVIALCAVIGGADNWVDVVQFGKAKKEWFATFLRLPNGIASHDTFGRLFQLIDSQVLQTVCIDWLQSIAGQVQGVVAIDGKSVRGSGHGAQAALHMVPAWTSWCKPFTATPQSTTKLRARSSPFKWRKREVQGTQLRNTVRNLRIETPGP